MVEVVKKELSVFTWKLKNEKRDGEREKKKFTMTAFGIILKGRVALKRGKVAVMVLESLVELPLYAYRAETRKELKKRTLLSMINV